MDRKDLDVTLYLVTDSTYHTEESLLHTVEEACKGGVTLVQLREKNKGAGSIWIRRLRGRRSQIVTMCH